MAGTAKKSVERVKRLKAGYPTKDASGKVTVFKKPPTPKVRKKKAAAKRRKKDSSIKKDRADQTQKLGY